MDELNGILTTINTVSEAIGTTTTAAAKLSEIKRTTGISKKQSKRLLTESDTYSKVGNAFSIMCQNNPGIVYMQKVGNFYMTNIAKVIELVNNNIDATEIVPDKPLDTDWLVRFLDVSGNTSQEEKQKILANVLVGKIRKPDSISYRTLRVLKDLTQEEIALFKKALNGSFYEKGRFAFIPRGNNEVIGLNTSEMMLLDECGLIDSSLSKCLNVEEQKKVGWLSIDENYLLLINIEKQEKINCNYFSKSAFELIPYLKISSVNENIIKQSAECIKNNHANVSLHKVNVIEDNQINYNMNSLV